MNENVIFLLILGAAKGLEFGEPWYVRLILSSPVDTGRPATILADIGSNKILT